jgi:hypothetical protein
MPGLFFFLYSGVKALATEVRCISSQ